MDQAAFASKNLDNLAHYTVRQSFIFNDHLGQGLTQSSDLFPVFQAF